MRAMLQCCRTTAQSGVYVCGLAYFITPRRLPVLSPPPTHNKLHTLYNICLHVCSLPSVILPVCVLVCMGICHNIMVEIFCSHHRSHRPCRSHTHVLHTLTRTSRILHRRPNCALHMCHHSPQTHAHTHTPTHICT